MRNVVGPCEYVVWVILVKMHLALDRNSRDLIGSDREGDIHTFKEAVEGLISRSTVSDIQYVEDEQFVRPTQVPFLLCDANKFVSLTGWQPELGFERILDDTIEYWRGRPV